ncbi:MAG TPA: aspartate aminotransferase family protein [Candidatus Binataceae bacterium]|jgi:acetylornithine/succinyldiaminopimelate/putrescine aminotransferase|nr:aspartate aminotransferase family protein [Candidatus Binataceae bacterium]
MDDLRADFLRHVAQTSPDPIGIEIERAEGAWLYARGGRRYLDFISGIGVANLGHANPRVIAAIKRQAERYLHVMVYGEYVLDAQVMLARRLAQLLPAQLGQVYFTNSGAEAIEGALKTARKHTGRSGFIAFDGAYHGDTMGALALAGNAAFRAPFEPLPGPVRHLPYGDIAALEAIDSTVAAVVIEPVQAEGGVRIVSVDFMRTLRARCDQTGALLIFDEVLTGFGRTGKLFALEHFGVTPDIVVLAKALGGGLPLGAFCASSSLLSVLAHDPPLGHITTFGGHPLSCAAGLAALEVMVEEDLPQRAAQTGDIILGRLAQIAERHIVALRGIGLLIGIELASAELTQRFVKRTIEAGVIVNWTLNCDRVVRLAPPLTIADNEIDFALETIERVVRS